jgi:DnaJ-class molecular chaperone
MEPKWTLYDTLQVSPRACPQVIRAAFRCLTQCNHPDKQIDDEASTERQAQINAAYAVLSDPTRRKRYDHELAAKPFLAERRMDSGGGPKRQTVGNEDANRAVPQSRPFIFRPLH